MFPIEFTNPKLVLIRTRYSHVQVTHLNDCLCSLLSHIVDGILIPQPIGTLHRVVEMPMPVILLHIAQCCIDPTLNMAKRNKLCISHDTQGKLRNVSNAMERHSTNFLFKVDIDIILGKLC